jgi:hypothetical protein
MDRVYSQYRFWCYEGNIHLSIKKRSHKEWRDLIRAELKGKGKNRHCSAACPICHISYDVDILSSDASARALAVGKVASHINSAHADALTDCD